MNALVVHDTQDSARQETGRLRYEILGPLRVTGPGSGSFIRAHKMQILLAVLLVRSGQVVPMHYLTDEIWGENAPRRSTAAVHVYISQLRKFLGQYGEGSSPIVTRPPGYLLNIDDGELDLRDFEKLVGLGRQQARAGQHEEAAASYAAALQLWRGPALGGLRDSRVVNAFAAWLDESRLECTEMMVESGLALGRHRSLISLLYSLVAQQPLHESFYRQLMLALYRSERQADALKVYQLARTTLRNDLGLEPCRSLRDLHVAILSGDRRLDLPAGAPRRG